MVKFPATLPLQPSKSKLIITVYYLKIIDLYYFRQSYPASRSAAENLLTEKLEAFGGKL